VVDDHAVDASVVELLTMQLAPAGVDDVLSDQPLQVLGRRSLAVVDLAARRERRVETG
jgi:hypothetical protein